MRVLFTTSPGIGHIFPTISLAHAIRAAGHEVRYATSGYTEAVARAGLHVVDSAPAVDFDAEFGRFAEAELENAERSRDDPGAGMELGINLFSHLSDLTADGTVRIAEAWRPDLVVYSPLQGDGPLAAAKLGIPAVGHTNGTLPVPHVHAFMRQSIAEAMSETYARHGVSTPPPQFAMLDVTPPSMRAPGALDEPSPDNLVLPMQCVPYNGGGVIADWLIDKPDRARIAITLGTVVPGRDPLGVLRGMRPMLAAAGEVDAEFVLALGDVDYGSLGDLPDNVRVAGYVPLGVLLRDCDAAIHHGGAGTTMTVLAAGIPQIVVPHGQDQFLSALQVQVRGVGLQAEIADVGVDLIRELLESEPLRKSAAEVGEEIVTLPSPAEVVAQLEKLAA